MDHTFWSSMPTKDNNATLGTDFCWINLRLHTTSTFVLFFVLERRKIWRSAVLSCCSVLTDHAVKLGPSWSVNFISRSESNRQWSRKVFGTWIYRYCLIFLWCWIWNWGLNYLIRTFFVASPALTERYLLQYIKII